MNRAVLFALTFSFAAIAGCGKHEAAPAQPVVTAPAPAAQAIGDSCSQDCGGGKVAAIQCAAGETPLCDCAASPNAVCKVPAAEPAKP